jgi:hypothetical protein
MKAPLWLPLLVLAACNRTGPPETQTAAPAAPPQATAASTAPAAPPAAPAAPAVKGPKLLPVDAATDDAALVAYRDELLGAVKRHDADAVIALVDPKIRTSFGGGGGAAGLRHSLEQPGSWNDLEQLLSLGGSFQGEGAGRSFWAPYVYSAFPDAQDAFESLVVVAAEVPLFETPDPNGHVVATLSHDIVTIVREAPSAEAGSFRHVKTADGRTGWVESAKVRSPIGYRAGFLKQDGKWRMNVLVAGD